jgi:hypothetical protein
VTLGIKASGRERIVIGNPWPACSDGVYESEPYRILAAEAIKCQSKPIGFTLKGERWA